MYLPRYLRRELEKKRAAIVDAPGARLRLYKKIRSHMVLESIAHTARGEIPVSKIHYTPSFTHTEEFRRVKRGIENAWSFGTIAYSTEGLTEEFLKHLAWEIDPEFFGGDTAYFRRPGTTTTMTHFDYVPPNPLKIQDDLYRYIFHPEGLERMTIPEQAIWYNFHISRIQPFPDCNKRTARTLQNLHLQSASYPPATILEGEAEYCVRLLGEAIHGFKERKGENHPSKPELEFFEFVGTRINNALDEILDQGQNVPPQLRSKKKKRK